MTAIELIDKLIEERKSETALCESLRQIRAAILEMKDTISGAIAKIDTNIPGESIKNAPSIPTPSGAQRVDIQQRERTVGIYKRKTPLRGP
jgi:hypothetical protein